MGYLQIWADLALRFVKSSIGSGGYALVDATWAVP